MINILTVGEWNRLNHGRATRGAQLNHQQPNGPPMVILMCELVWKIRLKQKTKWSLTMVIQMNHGWFADESWLIKVGPWCSLCTPSLRSQHLWSCNGSTSMRRHVRPRWLLSLPGQHGHPPMKRHPTKTYHHLHTTSMSPLLYVDFGFYTSPTLALYAFGTLASKPRKWGSMSWYSQPIL